MRRSLLIVPPAICLLLAAYAHYIEPNWLSVTHYKVTAPVSHPIKIALLTDIHTRSFGYREKALLRILEAERPDAIVITGDSIRYDGTYAPVKELYRFLRAPRGVWAVKGNWEDAMPWQKIGLGGSSDTAQGSEETFYDSTGVRLLNNTAGFLGDGVWLIGVDDFREGRPDFEKALKGVPPNAYRIALFHSPEYFDHIAGRVDLVLAGHTHGGQVRIPGFPPAYCPAGCGKYVWGWYEKNGTRMYVSRGIGTSIMEVRFNSRPEVAIFTLTP